MTRTQTVCVLVPLVVAGLVLRVLCARQSLYADEASTYWVTQRPFGDMLEVIANRMEITPPLSFVATWFPTRLGDGVLAYRAVPVLAGVAFIPVVYVVGIRTVGRTAGLVAAALVTISPFAIFYSGQSRAYSLLMLLVGLTVLCALLAIDTQDRRWWVGFAVMASASMQTHYTAVFALAVIYGWVVLAHPEHRRAATLAVIGAIVLFAPWGVTGFRNDLHSPDSRLASLYVTFTPVGVLRSLGLWLVGHPYDDSVLRGVPGPIGAGAIAIGLAIATAGLLRRRPAVPSRLALVIALALAAPIGEILASLAGPDTFTFNAMASSTVGAALLAGAVIQAAPLRLRAVAALLVVGGLAVGGVRAATPAFAGPDFAPAARLIDGQARSADVIIDASGAAFGTPGPLTPLDLTLDRAHQIVRFGVPQERDHQFYFEKPLTPQQAIRRAVELSGSEGRLFVSFVESAAFGPTSDPVPFLRKLGLPARFRLRSQEAVVSHFGRTDALLFSR